MIIGYDILMKVLNMYESYQFVFCLIALQLPIGQNSVLRFFSFARSGDHIFYDVSSDDPKP